MSNVEVYVIVEGKTEATFVRNVLAPELGKKGIFLYAAELGKVGRKGGNVRFDRASADIGRFLKQRTDTYISTMFDFYGINPDWPGRTKISPEDSAIVKADKMETATLEAIKKSISLPGIEKRFIPYLAMHEFEAMLFSNVDILAKAIDVNPTVIKGILKECGQPEEINDNPQTAPSKRLETLCSKKYRKIKMGNSIAGKIGIQIMRKKCPHFNEWLNKLEALAKGC